MTRAQRRAAKIEKLRAVLASDPAAYYLNTYALAQRLYFRGVRV